MRRVDIKTVFHIMARDISHPRKKLFKKPLIQINFPGAKLPAVDRPFPRPVIQGPAA